MRIGWFRGAIAIGLALWSAAAGAGDPAAAERHYRVARRLVAEGGASADAALEKVIELDPRGPLADDAWIDRAELLGLPGWPEELGRLDDEDAEDAVEMLARVVDRLAGADRAAEAAYLRALLHLEPGVAHDVSKARLDLLFAAHSESSATWAHRARYVLGWIAEHDGDLERARSAYSRLLVDLPATDTAARARVGLARVELGVGECGEAAVLLQDAVSLDVSESSRAEPLRELAVRCVLRAARVARVPAAVFERVAVPANVRDIVDFVATPDGGVALLDRRGQAVIALDARGAEVDRWEVVAPQALAAGPFGTIFVAAGHSIYRLLPDGEPVPVAGQGEWAPASALAADGRGGLWLLDRRGERLGRIDPGGDSPRAVLEGSRLASIAWDGRRIVALDTRERRVVAIEGGAIRALPAPEFQRPVSLTASLDGSFAVLDVKAGQVVVMDREGRPLETVPGELEDYRASRISFGLDGVLHGFDDARNVWARAR